MKNIRYIKTNKFLEVGLSTLAGMASSLALTGFAQHLNLIPKATDVLYSSNQALGVGAVGVSLGGV